MNQQQEKERFEAANARNWRETFADPCTEDWTKQWFLDGEIATVSNGPEGMTLTAGPEHGDNAHHMVLWTRREFAGDLKIEYDWTRRDNEDRCVNILYLQAAGCGEEGYDPDISTWNDKRTVPHMWIYSKYMHLYHISYAAFTGNGTESYIRGRRYRPDLKKMVGVTELTPEYRTHTLFARGVPHHITVIKQDRDLFLKFENEAETFYGHMRNENHPVITEGRIGLRQMYTRCSTYKDLKVFSPAG